MSRPQLSFIIVSYNTEALLRQCLDSLYDQTRGCDFEVVVIDNASQDGSVQMLKTFYPDVVLIESPDNLGFGKANNLGATAARGDYLIFLNSDTVLLEDTGCQLVDYLHRHTKVACIGPRIVGSDRRPQARAFGNLPSPWRLFMQAIGGGMLGWKRFEGIDGAIRDGEEMVVGWLSGVCLCVRRVQFLEVGGFDPRFFMYAEDVALCARLRRFGYSILLDRADVVHFGGASSPSRASQVRNAVWQQRHILQVCEDEFGVQARRLGSMAVALGLIGRMLLAILRIPRESVKGNFLLATSVARFVDLLGYRTIPSQPASPRRVHG